MRATNRLGPIPTFEYEDKEDQLHDWVANSNQGVMGFTFGDVPPECFAFCMSQYHRFNVPVTDLISEIIIAGSCAAFYYLDCVDPYAIFCGLTDVEMTDDWANHAYEVIDGRVAYEVEPTSVETFIHIPYQDELIFNDIMSKPGLRALPRMLGECISDVLDGEYGSDCYYTLTSQASAELRRLCTMSDGSINKEMERAYFELASWATVAWLCGPLGRNFRYGHHDIFNVATDNGEAILVDGSVLGPKYYRKLSRPPRSCLVCGLPAWCVEMIGTSTGSRYMCEHCLSEGMPPSALSTCGSKRCLLTACHHHPYHHLGTAGIHYARKDFGQLGASARGESALRIRGGKGV